jgi:putative peptide zinc metalloprotease protein
VTEMAGVAEGDVLAPVVSATVATGNCRVHRLAAGTELLGEYKDSAYQDPRYLVQRADGQVMQLPGLLYRVACSLDGRDDDQIAAEVNAELGQDLTAEQVSFLVEERLRPVGLVAPDDGEPATPDDGVVVAPPMPVRSDPLLALRYRVGVIPAGVAWRIAGFFRAMFARPAWIVLLSAFVAADLWIVAQGDILGRMVAGVRDIALHPAFILAILGLGVVSSAFHECGHVTACRYGGARPGELGVGLYLVWPAFYSTVTDSYRLDRVGRLRTDLGGVYFNAVFMLGLGLVYVRTGEPWLLIALIGMHVGTAWQFLPLLRMDGYYVLADLVGVPDLFGFVRPVLASLLPWRPTHPLIRQLRPRARRSVLLWVVVVVPMLTFYLVAFLLAAPRVLPAAWRATLEYLQRLDGAARAGDVVATTLGVTQLLLLALPWIGVGLIVWSLVGMLRRRLISRWGLGRIGVTGRPAIRRTLSLAALGALGALLVTRVAVVASSHPATTGEARLSASALAALRGVDGGPAVGPGEWLARQQLMGYAGLTRAFDRHASVVTGGRELAVVASAVLVVCALTLVLVRRLAPLAVAVPITATLTMGPAVTALATAGPALLGAAWTAVGVLVLTRARHRGVMLLGGLAIAVGVATEPMLAVPLAAGMTAMLAHDQLDAGRPAWWPRRPPRGVVAARHGRADPAMWLAMALLLALGAFGAVLTSDRGDASLDRVERTVLLLVVVVVVGVGLMLRPLRPPALAAAALVVFAALPRPGAGSALLLAVVAAMGLVALVADALTRGPTEERPHPLLRVAVAVPTLVVTVVGALFLPVSAGGLPHAELAAWITGPSSAGGVFAVPPGLWGDLVRDGVPADRLVLATGPGSSAAADWRVEVGDTPSRDGAPVGFGAGPMSLSVRPLPPATNLRREAENRVAERRTG